MLKVLNIITRLEKGGSSKNVIYSLKNEKVESFLIFGYSNFNEEIKDFNKNNSFFIKELKRKINIFYDLISFFKIYFIILKLKPDIIHTHTSKAGILGRAAAFFYKKLKNKNIKIVHTPHGHLLYGYFSFLKTFLFKKIEVFFSYFTDYYIALTIGEMNESINAKIGNKNNWIVVPSGIDFPEKIIDKKTAREKIKIKENVFLISTIARLEKVKGIDIFIKGVFEFENKYKPNLTQYLIIGEGSLKEKLISLRNKLGLKDKIIFTGFKENIYDYLIASDLYLQTSLNEAMGRSVLEAEFSSLPIIVSSACGLPYIVKENKNGLIFKNKDFLDLAEKINILYQDKEKLKFFSKNSKLEVSKKDDNDLLFYSFLNMNFKILNFYDKIIKKGDK